MTDHPRPAKIDSAATADAVPETRDAVPSAPEGRSAKDRQRLGILLICASSLIFASQDAVGRHLASLYPAPLIVMLRYWFFAAFACWLVSREPGGISAALHTRHIGKQILRGLLLAANVLLMLVAFVKMGLVETHAAFSVSPLMVVALSGPMLGEKVGWRRWLAIAVGFFGILVILQPGVKVFSPWALLPLVSALMFAVYALLTRQLSADDGATVNFFWAGITGAAFATLPGLWYAEWMAPVDWPWMIAMCLTSAVGHLFLIRAYENAEASSLQPFAYTQLVWVSLIGVFILGEKVGANVVIGMAIVVGAGLFTWWRAMQRARQQDQG